MKVKVLRLAAVVFIALLCVHSASADQFTFTATNNIDSNHPGSALITFTTIANGFTINVINLVSNPTVQTQILTGIQLNLKTTLSGATLQPGNFTQINFATPSTFVSQTTNSGWGLSSYQFSSPTGGTTSVLSLCPAGSGSSCALKPGIIGGPSASPSASDYSNSNPSVDGPGHPTYLLGDQANGGALFTVTGTGNYNQLSDFINTVFFQWGTTSGQTTNGGPPTPEPSSLLLMGSGLAGLASAVRRKMNR